MTIYYLLIQDDGETEISNHLPQGVSWDTWPKCVKIDSGCAYNLTENGWDILGYGKVSYSHEWKGTFNPNVVTEFQHRAAMTRIALNTEFVSID